MDTMFIDFKGHILKIAENKKGKLSCTESNREELELAQADLILLDGDPEEVLNNVYNSTVNTAYSDIKKEWEKDLKKNVMKLLGFSDTWGKWEIDHCNGRMSEMSDLINQEVKKLFMETNFTKEQLTLTEKEKQDIGESIRKDMRDRFSYEYRQSFRGSFEQLVKQQATQDAKEEFEKLVATRQLDTVKVLAQLNTEINRKK